MQDNLKITGGIYLVLDPAMEKVLLLSKLSEALKAGISAVQIWNNWQAGADKLEWIEDIAGLCSFFNVPLLINEDWELLAKSSYIQGIHFDKIPDNIESIRKTVGREFLTGITCSGNLDTVHWAQENNCDYISFCAMFPSASAGECSIVMPATVNTARAITSMPLFVSGGITPSNIITLKKETSFDGVAVISGILSADKPLKKIKEYKDALNN